MSVIAGRFWRFVMSQKELEALRAQMSRAQMSKALAECVDPARFVLEAIAKVFPVDRRSERSDKLVGNDFWAGTEI